MKPIDRLQVEISDKSVIVRYPSGLRACSSAPWGGGISRVSAIANYRVGNKYCCDNPSDDLINTIKASGLEPPSTIGLLTAAQVAEAGVEYLQGQEFSIWAIVTAGVGNALRAGCAEQTFPGYQSGTINTIVIIDANLTDAALINGVITATEAKTAALQDEQVVDSQGRIVTGTSTDAVVIACTEEGEGVERPLHLYAGTATELGNALAQAVNTATRQAIRREKLRQEKENKSSCL